MFMTRTARTVMTTVKHLRTPSHSRHALAAAAYFTTAPQPSFAVLVSRARPLCCCHHNSPNLNVNAMNIPSFFSTTPASVTKQKDKDQDQDQDNGKDGKDGKDGDVVAGLAKGLTRFSICLPPVILKDLILTGGIQLTVDGMEYNLQATPTDATKSIMDQYRTEIAVLETLLAPLEEEKRKLDVLASSFAKKVVIGALTYLIAQAWIVAKLTFASRLGWDIMEPVTYLVTFITGVFGLAYFSVSRRDYLYETVWDQVLNKRQEYLYEKNQFDLRKYDQLIDELANKEEKLARMVVP